MFARALVASVLIVLLVEVGHVAADPRTGRPPAANAQQRAAKNAVTQQRNLTEVTMLQNAHILLSNTNSNYKGHREKAIRYVEMAIKNLDAQLATRGLPAQKLTA